jgi:hypothetical protein
MTKKPRLTDLHLVLLSSAAQRPDDMLLPPPEFIRAKSKTLERSLEKLLGLGLIEECPATTAEQAWRDEGDGRRVGLRIAIAGREALGLGEGPITGVALASLDSPSSDIMEDGVPATGASKSGGTVEVATTTIEGPLIPVVKPGTKQARLVNHLSAADGAKIADLAAFLSWQPHTVRAALTGLRKKGYSITSAKDGAGTTVYRITPAVEAVEDAA